MRFFHEGKPSGPGFLYVLVIIYCFAVPINLQPQSTPVSPSEASVVLREQQERGRALFLQRCSLCHLPPPEIKPKMRPSSGPILVGLFQNANPEKEKAAREIILKGTPNMPGFQYGLEPKDIDDLIAFLKTLNDRNSYMNGL